MEDIFKEIIHNYPLLAHQGPQLRLIFSATRVLFHEGYSMSRSILLNHIPHSHNRNVRHAYPSLT